MGSSSFGPDICGPFAVGVTPCFI